MIYMILIFKACTSVKEKEVWGIFMIVILALMIGGNTIIALCLLVNKFVKVCCNKIKTKNKVKVLANQ